MPVYEYECLSCGEVTEVMQKFSDAPLTECEHCGGEMRKLISQSAFHLKGSGWYVTDYARKDPRRVTEKSHKPTNSAKTESKSESASGKTSDTTS